MHKLAKISTLASASVLAALALPAAVHAAGNPFHAQSIAGYQLADAAMTEAKCGAAMHASGDAKTEEGKCGGAAAAKTEEGKCGGAKSAKTEEGKCGANKDAAAAETKMPEGKCGEAKCGANKKKK